MQTSDREVISLRERFERCGLRHIEHDID